MTEGPWNRRPRLVVADVRRRNSTGTARVSFRWPPPFARRLWSGGWWLLIVFATQVSAADPVASTNSPLRETLAELSRLEKPIPFKEVIQAATHHRILDFNTNNAAHVALKTRIEQAAELAAANARKDGLFANRANEAGNHIEKFVRAALREVGLDARVPVNTAGEAQATGYPDVEILGNPPCYLELKTYNASTVNTTQRTFYFSPSEHPKVTHDALHLLLGFQLERMQRDGRTAFVPVHWKLVTLQGLRVHLKFEFNQNNRGLYGEQAGDSLLGEAEIK